MDAQHIWDACKGKFVVNDGSLRQIYVLGIPDDRIAQLASVVIRYSTSGKSVLDDFLKDVKTFADVDVSKRVVMAQCPLDIAGSVGVLSCSRIYSDSELDADVSIGYGDLFRNRTHKEAALEFFRIGLLLYAETGARAIVVCSGEADFENRDPRNWANTMWACVR